MPISGEGLTRDALPALSGASSGRSSHQGRTALAFTVGQRASAMRA